jgi:hypothetical protein
MDGDCISGDYCDGTHQCVPQKQAGQPCQANDQCASLICGVVGGVCCDPTDITCL